MPPHLKKSTNQAYLENGSYEHIVTHLERHLELNSLEAPDELQMNTMTQNQQIEGDKDNTGSINSNADNSNPKNNKNDRTSETVCLPCGTCGNTNYTTKKCQYGANAANRPLPWKSRPARRNRPQVQDEQNNIIDNMQAVDQPWN